MVKLSAQFEDHEVFVMDVDDLFIWFQVRPDADTQWNVGVPWSRIVGLLEEPIEDLKKELEKHKSLIEEVN